MTRASCAMLPYGMKRAIYKVPNGKLLKLFLEDRDGKIVSIKITGDFFLYPEENIEKLEQKLAGTALTHEALAETLANFLKETPTTLFGLDADSLITTILNAA